MEIVHYMWQILQDALWSTRSCLMFKFVHSSKYHATLRLRLWNASPVLLQGRMGKFLLLWNIEASTTVRKCLWLPKSPSSLITNRKGQSSAFPVSVWESAHPQREEKVKSAVTGKLWQELTWISWKLLRPPSLRSARYALPVDLKKTPEVQNHSLGVWGQANMHRGSPTYIFLSLHFHL